MKKYYAAWVGVTNEPDTNGWVESKPKQEANYEFVASEMFVVLFQVQESTDSNLSEEKLELEEAKRLAMSFFSDVLRGVISEKEAEIARLKKICDEAKSS